LSAVQLQLIYHSNQSIAPMWGIDSERIPDLAGVQDAVRRPGGTGAAFGGALVALKRQ
jgi:hypothetical protein